MSVALLYLIREFMLKSWQNCKPYFSGIQLSSEAEIVGGGWSGESPPKSEIIGKSDTLSVDLDQFLVKTFLIDRNYELPAILDDLNFNFLGGACPKPPR